jgi:hypothetical protein
MIAKPFHAFPTSAGAASAQDRRGQAEMAVYVTDRFGEVFATFRESEKQAMPGVQEILEWLTFVNSQCPECSPPEWPV